MHIECKVNSITCINSTTVPPMFRSILHVRVEWCVYPIPRYQPCEPHCPAFRARLREDCEKQMVLRSGVYRAGWSRKLMGTIWNADVQVEDGSRMLALASPREATRPQHHDEVRACWGTPEGPLVSTLSDPEGFPGLHVSPDHSPGPPPDPAASL